MALADFLSQNIQKYFLTKPPLQAHKTAIRWLRFMDSHPYLLSTIEKNLPQEKYPTKAGGVNLVNPLIVAAGLVKGDGFGDEAEAMKAVTEKRNIIPGWRSVPALSGAVEMGTFTPSPRIGHNGTTMWRDTKAKTLYNSVGLRNPGARAVSVFLSERQDYLPSIYGISLAADPDETNLLKKCQGIGSAAKWFADAQLRPSWITINFSCPNITRYLNKSAKLASDMIDAVREELPEEIPLWMKISPDMTYSECEKMVEVFESGNISAIVAGNSYSVRTPSHVAVLEKAGISGANLKHSALKNVRFLSKITDIDIIGCGGILNGNDMLDFKDAGAKAFQYWSALVFRGVNAGNQIIREYKRITV